MSVMPFATYQPALTYLAECEQTALFSAELQMELDMFIKGQPHF